MSRLFFWASLGLLGLLGCSGDDASSTEPAASEGQGGSAAAGQGGASGKAGKAGSSVGGSSTGGSATGGSSVGGSSAGGSATGGSSTGGSAAGGSTTGGAGGAAAGASGGAVGGGAGASGGAGQGAALFELHEKDRKACLYGPGKKTTETIGAQVPHGDALPFEHIVVLMMENRSFDHYFSKLPKVGVTDVDVADETHFNYDPDTSPPSKVPFHHETRYCIKDVNHEWAGVHLQYSGGKMDGFVATNNPGGARAMGYYDDTDLPYYYWLSKTFSISDRNFCSLLGPTWPNRFYFYGATSWGNTETGDLGDILPGSVATKGKKITDQLEEAGRTWKIYRDGIVSFAIVFEQSPSYYGSPMSKFDEDVDADTLPNLAILDPSFTGDDQNDEHPPANIQKGQKLVERVVSKLMSKPEVWKKTVFFLVYDEHGGYYDHVPPPEACPPDDFVPPDFKFDRLGVRTPLIVVSPFAKKGYVSHRVSDHTSVTRFIQNRFDLPALTERDANAWPLLDMFDFDNPSFPTPPTGAPAAEVSASGEEFCKNNPPGVGLPP